MKKKVTVEDVLELQRQTLETLRQELELLRLAQQPIYITPQPYTPYVPPAGPISPTWQEPNGTPWAPIVTCGGTNQTSPNTDKYFSWNGIPPTNIKDYERYRLLVGMPEFTGTQSCLNEL